MSDKEKRASSGGTPLRSTAPRDGLPREKALAYGIKALSDAELMAIIFGTGIQGKNVIKMCEEILDDNAGHISKVARMDIHEFMRRYKGIGPAKALTMLAALELGSRSTADALKIDDPTMSSADMAFQYMKHYLDGLNHEEFWILLLKQNLKPLRAIRVGQGGLNATVVDVKVILREALLAASPAIMLFHNHPSGQLAASIEDEKLTNKICQAAELLGIRVLDHIIIGVDRFFSFHNAGLM